MKASFSSFNEHDCVLKANRVDIWEYPLHTLFEGAASLLNLEEKARATRYHFEKHQRRFTIARAMMRLILARYTDEAPEALTFEMNAYGKPALTKTPQLQFNLSHSGDLALLAIGKDYPLGIDLEFFSARPYEGIGRQMFSSSENEALKQTQSLLKPLAFFNVWAQKEAFIKACGLGLSYPTQDFSVKLLPNENQHVHDALHQTTWNMIAFQPKPACCAALCCDLEVNEVRYLRVQLSYR